MDIYTDGACNPNPGKGAWSLVVVQKEEITLIRNGTEFETTNNRMELKGIIKALEYVLENNLDATIHTDSTYCLGFCLKEFKAKKNKDLTEELSWLISECEKQELNIDFKWIKGHSGNLGNDAADFYANKMVGL